MKLCWVFASISLVLTTTNHVGSVMASDAIDHDNNAQNGFLAVGDTHEPSSVPSTPPSTLPGSVPTFGNLINNSAGLVDAIRDASTDPMSPSTIYVDVNAEIDFDDGTTTAPSDGLNLLGKYFDAICIGYDEMRKCMMKRSVGGGRFFKSTSQCKFSFEGFEFNAGVAPGSTSGGAFSIVYSGWRKPITFHSVSKFTDCTFVNNTSLNRGGALFYKFDGRPSDNSFTRVLFDSNSASAAGGAIYAFSEGNRTVDLSITQSHFSNNYANGAGNDILAENLDSNGQVDFHCTDTTTSGTSNDVEVPPRLGGGVPQICYSPSSSPSMSNAPSASLLPSSIPSMSVAPSVGITDTAGFISAIEGASEDPMSPSTIRVDPTAVIDFDDNTTNVGYKGLDIGNKYFHLLCAGYDEMRKCILERSVGGGRFFQVENKPFNASITGFEIIGGGKNANNALDYGGVLSLQCMETPCAATFSDCVFIRNVARKGGGALYLKSTRPSSLSFIGCRLARNRVLDDDGDGGGAIYAISARSNQASGPVTDLSGPVIDLNIRRTTFSGNAVPSAGSGKDVLGKRRDGAGDFFLSCTKTMTSGTRDNVRVPKHKGVSQTCHSTRTQNQEWHEITYDGFGSFTGWGHFTANGTDATIGSGSARLHGESFITHIAGYNVKSFANLRVQMRYNVPLLYATDLFLEYSSDGGGSWTILQETFPFHLGYHIETVNFDESGMFGGPSYLLTDQAKIRVRSKIGVPVLIDWIRFEGLLY